MEVNEKWILMIVLLEGRGMLFVLEFGFKNPTTNGHQLPCLIEHQEMTISPEQTAIVRLLTSLYLMFTQNYMVINAPCFYNEALASPKQTAIGKDFSNPLIVDSLLKTIWSSMHHVFTMKHWLVQSKRLLRSAEATTGDNGEVKITATIDGHSMTITEASLRRHLKLDDHDGITSIPNSEIFEQLALMGYHTNSDNPKKTAWEQFSSNIATDVICLATNRKFNFSRLIFEHMVSNISSAHKFLMYPRFIQICLDMQRKQLHQHSRAYLVPSLSIKVFNNMKRPTKGYSGQEVALFPTMLHVSEPFTSSQLERLPVPTPNESPLHAVHSHGSAEGSLQLNELTILVTKLSERIGVLEDDLTKTKLTYSSTVTKLILRVKKLEAKVKAGTARKRAWVVLSKDDEDIEDDSSKQERIKLSDAEVQEKASNETEPLFKEVNYH
ncbi:hypothetical protein Tco_0106014 [Tanacetum coccineum]